MPAIRVVMPNGTTRSFREGTPKSVIRRAQQDMLADMKALGLYDGFDFSEFDDKRKPVQVTQFGPTRIAGPEEIDPGLGASAIPMLPMPEEQRQPVENSRAPRPRSETPRGQAEELLNDKRVQAFLATIRDVESNGRYNVRNGGATFSGYGVHPGPQTGRSSAAGAYQMMEGTWKEQAGRLGLRDFSPESQDLATVNLLREKGAIGHLLDGNLDQAIYAAGSQWATFPKDENGNHIGKGGPVSIQPLRDGYNRHLR